MRHRLGIMIVVSLLASGGATLADDAKTRAVGNIGDFFKSENQTARQAAPSPATQPQPAASTKRRQGSREAAQDNARRR